MTEVADEKRRVDKWLWYARVVKSRTLAAKLAAGGHVRLNRAKISSASQSVRVGDVLTITLPRAVKVLRILNLGERRGPAAEARLLFEDLSPAPPPRVAAPEPNRPPGAGRPTKRERRLIDRMRERGG